MKSVKQFESKNEIYVIYRLLGTTWASSKKVTKSKKAARSAAQVKKPFLYLDKSRDVIIMCSTSLRLVKYSGLILYCQSLLLIIHPHHINQHEAG